MAIVLNVRTALESQPFHTASARLSMDGAQMPRTLLPRPS
jgi:hypothetical protein